MPYDAALLSALRDALPGIGGLAPTTEDLEAVAACGETIVYKPGDLLYEQDEPSVWCHLVIRGVVELFRPGERDRVIARLGSGRFVGDIAVFLGVPYLSSARSGTFAEIRWMRRECLVDVLRTRPAVTYAWLQSAMATLAEAHGRLEVVLSRTAVQQVAGALLDLPETGNRVEVSQSELASMLGIGRQAINRALGELMEAGLVRTGYRFVEIFDRDGLMVQFGGDGDETSVEATGA